MKNFIIISLLVPMLCGANYIEHNYIRENCIVIEAHNNNIKVKDKSGFIWSFNGEGFFIGDIVDLKMYDNTTTTHFDDIIKDVIKK